MPNSIQNACEEFSVKPLSKYTHIKQGKEKLSKMSLLSNKRLIWQIGCQIISICQYSL
jgi:hypothetical protein